MANYNIKQLEEMVDQFLKEKFEQPVQEAELQVPTTTGSDDGLTPDQKKSVLNARKKGTPVKFVKKTDTAMDEKRSKGEEETQAAQDTPEAAPASLDDFRNAINDITSKLEGMDDFKIGDKEDLKAKKLINKIKLKLDDVLLVMDDLEEIKSGLEEKKAVYEEKANDQYIKQVHKLLSKRFKDKKDVEGVMQKYAATAKKHKDKDPNKVAEALFRHMLKESANLHELSPELKHAAAMKASKEFEDNDEYNPMKANKRLSQAHKMASHVDPEVIKAGEKISDKLKPNNKVVIDKVGNKRFDTGIDFVVAYMIYNEDGVILYSVYITPKKVLVKTPLKIEKFPGFDNVMSKFVELVRKKEFPTKLP